MPSLNKNTDLILWNENIYTYATQAADDGAESVNHLLPHLGDACILFVNVCI